MRDPERIDRILKRVEKIWKANPDLRLMQLLINCLDEENFYFTEDTVLEQELKMGYDETGGKWLAN